jgi:hypothetical protein
MYLVDQLYIKLGRKLFVKPIINLVGKKFRCKKKKKGKKIVREKLHKKEIAK